MVGAFLMWGDVISVAYVDGVFFCGLKRVKRPRSSAAGTKIFDEGGRRR